MGLEPTTTGITIRGSTNWAIATIIYSVIHVNSGALDKIRTCDLWLRRPTLYPTELRALIASCGAYIKDLCLACLAFFLEIYYFFIERR